MALGTELTLLAIDAGPEHVHTEPALPFGLAVAELVDLAASGRITLVGERIEVLDRSPTGDALTDDTLARLADVADLADVAGPVGPGGPVAPGGPGGPGAGLSVEQWLERHAPARVEAYLAGLTSSPATGPDAAAAVAADRLRAVLAGAREPLPVRDLAFAVLANATGWPKERLRGKAGHTDRARLERLTREVAGSGDAAAYDGDAAFSVLRLGIRAAAQFAEQSRLSGTYDPAAKWSWRIVSDVVAVLSVVTIVIACMKNVALAIIITPFCIALMAPSLVNHAERHRQRSSRRALR